VDNLDEDLELLYVILNGDITIDMQTLGLFHISFNGTQE
jgi:hypothetical protein